MERVSSESVGCLVWTSSRSEMLENGNLVDGVVSSVPLVTISRMTTEGGGTTKTTWMPMDQGRGGGGRGWERQRVKIENLPRSQLHHEKERGRAGAPTLLTEIVGSLKVR